MERPATSPLVDRSLLVTGSGTFANAFVRRALQDGARRIVVYSRSELVQAQMRAALPDSRLRFFLGDVRDRPRLVQAMNGVEIVAHGAALKRIDACEADVDEAIATNVTGTQNVAHAAILAGVERGVFLSTDKAPLACTAYGMSKALAERAWIQSNAYAAGGPTQFSCTRYGNVLGSRGSVLDLWRRQFEAGEPLTITDERATRFWMTIRQAVDLVCVALEHMRGGEVFVPLAGSAPILDLARAVVEQDGQPYAPGHVCTGLRAGERLHETLISPDEARTTYRRGDVYVIEPQYETWGRPVAWDLTPPASDGFSYRSDTNPQRLSVAELKALVAAC